MIKFLSVAILLFLLVSGTVSCRSASSLERTPRKKPVKSYKNPTNPTKTAPRKTSRKTPKETSGDPLFDAVFKRKPQKHDGISSLNDKERALIRDMQDGSNAGQTRSIKQKMNKSATERKDWVFGTENGSYF